MIQKYELTKDKAEQIIETAKFETEYKDTSDIKLYYDLYDEIGEIGLIPEDLSLYRQRLDIIFDNILRYI
jgi:hypothetical protein